MSFRGSPIDRFRAAVFAGVAALQFPAAAEESRRRPTPRWSRAASIWPTRGTACRVTRARKENYSPAATPI